MPLASKAIEDGVRMPSRLRVRSHPRYNCHGLTFASRRSAIHDDGDIYRILREDGYIQIQAQEALPGDIVLYYTQEGNVEHSAVVVSIGEAPFYVPQVFSKWGAIGPEVIHAVTNCDYPLADIRYYRVVP